MGLKTSMEIQVLRELVWEPLERGPVALRLLHAGRKMMEGPMRKLWNEKITWTGSAVFAAAILTAGFVVRPGVSTFGPRSLASIAPQEAITRDQSLSDKMTELKMERERAPDVEGDLARLGAKEGQYRERLPGLSGHAHLRGVVARVSKTPYRPSRK